MSAETKQCPFCKEEIHVEAIKCKHCGEFLNKDTNQKDNSINNNDLNIGNPFWKSIIMHRAFLPVLFSLIIIFFFFPMYIYNVDFQDNELYKSNEDTLFLFIILSRLFAISGLVIAFFPKNKIQAVLSIIVSISGVVVLGLLYSNITQITSEYFQNTKGSWYVIEDPINPDTPSFWISLILYVLVGILSFYYFLESKKTEEKKVESQDKYVSKQNFTLALILGSISVLAAFRAVSSPEHTFNYYSFISISIWIWLLYFLKNYLLNFSNTKTTIWLNILIAVGFLDLGLSFFDSSLNDLSEESLQQVTYLYYGLFIGYLVTSIFLGIRLKSIKDDFVGNLNTLGVSLIVIPTLWFLFLISALEIKDNKVLDYFAEFINQVPTIIIMYILLDAQKNYKKYLSKVKVEPEVSEKSNDNA